METNQEAGNLSSFPDEILIHIISFLPLQEAVKTCMLSRRWRNLFTLVSNLNLDESSFTRKKRCDIIDYEFMDFVDQFLSRHAGIIVDKFFIRRQVQGFLDDNRVDKWIEYALHKKVRELEVCLYYYSAIIDKGKTGIFNCNTLEVLRLSNYFVRNLPAIICVPSLKFLQLPNVCVSDEDSLRNLENLISSCSVLEELVILVRCLAESCKFNVFNPTLKRLTLKLSEGYEEVGIDAPSLVYFNYSSRLPKLFLLKHLNSLVKVHIDFRLSATYNSAAFHNLFEAISHVQSLELSGLVAEVFLKHFASNACPSPAWSQLKTLRIFRFGGTANEVQMVEYFLKIAKALEIFTIQIVKTDSKMAAEWRSKITSLPKTAKDCRILVV